MPTCQMCNKKWSWKETIKRGFTLDIGMKCPHCEGKQYHSEKSRVRIFISSLIVLSPMLLPIVFNMNSLLVLIIFFVLACLVFLLQPFLIELANHEEQIRIK
ncbi:TIGR04104 family putative zinc finger protein [Halalkalibacter okhensis]|uniref:CXXC-20-CXXC protein n=1 Tax=Halalkalibacter okhensis TaxID=333138 RepID=A0A0B0IHX5_9BACI|nr:hypothetical protein LQ50_16315 [Halalkalibacter okhensis]